MPAADASPEAVALAAHQRRRAGVAYGLAAYGCWGLFPIYLKAILHIGSFEILAHRVFWCFVFLVLLLGWLGKFGEVRRALASKRTVATLLVTTVLISVNWLVFIHAVNTDRVLQASLGYFINPLVSIFLGFVFLGERLRKSQWASVALAVAGVSYMTFIAGLFPWMSLILAGSFGLYGLLRKTAQVGTLEGLTIETALVAPLALGYIVWLSGSPDGGFLAGSTKDDVLLALSGIVTALPLLWFTAAARRLRLATMGFMQYMAPSMHFILAVAVYGEAFTADKAVAFGLIWAGLAIFTVGAVRSASEARRSVDGVRKSP